jgi:hypothetical protein
VTNNTEKVALVEFQLKSFDNWKFPSELEEGMNECWLEFESWLMQNSTGESI